MFDIKRYGYDSRNKTILLESAIYIVDHNIDHNDYYWNIIKLQIICKKKLLYYILAYVHFHKKSKYLNVY